MKKELTAEYMHDMLKRSVFSDIDPQQVAAIPKDQRNKVTLAQIDKILGIQSYGSMLEWYISQFIDSEKHPKLKNPLYNEPNNPLLDWYLEVCFLGHSLYQEEPFDLAALDPALATEHKANYKKAFVIDNTALVNWLRETPYHRVAAMVATIMMKLELKRVFGKNDAIQDYYAEQCNTADFDIQNEDEACQVVETVLNGLTEIRQHETAGRQLGLDNEQRRVVDLLWSWVPHDYPEPYIKAAKEIIKTVKKLMPPKTMIRSQKGFKIFYASLLPELIKIVEKYDLPVDLTDRYNLTIGYMYDWVRGKYMKGVVLYE